MVLERETGGGRIQMASFVIFEFGGLGGFVVLLPFVLIHHPITALTLLFHLPSLAAGFDFIYWHQPQMKTLLLYFIIFILFKNKMN